MISESHEFQRGEIDGKHDGAAKVRPLGDTILQMVYSQSYQAGYRRGYEQASRGLAEVTARE